MYTDPVEAEYFQKRLQISLEMAENASDAGAVQAHGGLAACYRAKLISLTRAEAPKPRAVLSLDAYREKRQAQAFQISRMVEPVGYSAARS